MSARSEQQKGPDCHPYGVEPGPLRQMPQGMPLSADGGLGRERMFCPLRRATGALSLESVIFWKEILPKKLEHFVSIDTERSKDRLRTVGVLVPSFLPDGENQRIEVTAVLHHRRLGDIVPLIGGRPNRSVSTMSRSAASKPDTMRMAASLSDAVSTSL